MADDSPFLQVDTDWKKQAQEEKRKLAEKAAQQKAQAEAAAAAAAAKTAAPEEAAPVEKAGSFAGLVQQLMTQALIYLGEISYRGSPPMLDLDRAKTQHDILTMLEEKTANNLSDDERKLLDSVLHEVRSRFIRTASEYVTF
ncbi:DUF1844 domain-containing protein [Humisphaera borealis]|uniref:DUF1844 domain-containing protein n=1 Tax=Humisphaera borealis TaxID=2807512 RepID=A0A7M2WWH5_9BACT|nr:DUF1844 domain-containing protein [Humisphaera borealis]QOV89898.1 DUF1844 domain-containing protein [Humisphaera borealis]